MDEPTLVYLCYVVSCKNDVYAGSDYAPLSICSLLGARRQKYSMFVTENNTRTKKTRVLCVRNVENRYGYGAAE